VIFLRPHIPTFLLIIFKNLRSQYCGQINIICVCVCVYIFLQHGLRLGRGKVGLFHGYSLLISHELKTMLIFNFSIVKLLTATSVNLFRFPFFFSGKL